jgi:hypothetical protein
MRGSLVLWMLGATAVMACTACSPFMFRQVPDGLAHEDGVERRVRRFYAYGQFCGGGYPAGPESETQAERRVRLKAHYPPHDDLDAICFAHDHCYADGGTNLVSCDSVLLKMMIDYENQFMGKGCWNVSTDVVIAFFGKFWEKGSRGSETVSNRLVGVSMGVPFALFWMVLKTPARPFLANPPVIEGHGTLGTCNLQQESDPEKMFAEFERRYLTALFNDQNYPFRVPRHPVPAETSESRQ